MLNPVFAQESEFLHSKLFNMEQVFRLDGIFLEGVFISDQKSREMGTFIHHLFKYF